MQNKYQDKVKPEGKTIVFYSYKGGVGRTMSLVNIACLMAKQQKKILLIDWDLEAPGLHSYFPTMPSKTLGLVDMITQAKAFLRKNTDNNEEGYLQFLKANLNKYISKDVEKKLKNNIFKVDIIKAGKFDEKYVDKLNAINWMNFYEKHPAFFRAFALFLEEKYDYILIDSRTGLADTSGICTMLMPQILVLVFSLNNQNLNGVVDIARQSIEYRYNSFDYRDLSVLPLPSRIDEKNYDEYKIWMAKSKEKFESLFKELYPLDDCDLDNYFNLAKIPYNPSYAYGENIPTLSEDINDDLFISHHYAKFLKLIELKEQIWEILNEQQQRNKNEAIEQYVSGKDEYNRRKYTETCKKFEKAYQLYPSNDRGYYQWKIDIFYQWGNAYFDLAELEDNISLFEQGYIKYKEALDLDAYQTSSFCNRDIANRVLHTPVEIQEQGTEAVAYYLAELGKSVTHLNEARIIIVGEKGAGKTSLARRLINPNSAMTTDRESAIGIDAFLWKPEHDDINIHIWDFAGHSVTHAVHKFFLSERCLYILVYDGRTESRNRLEYWLSQIKNYGGKSEIFILVNKRDAYFPNIPINSLKDKYPIAGYYTLSIQDDKNLLDVFRKDVIRYIKNNPSWSNQVIPASYFNVKKKIEQQFAENPEIEHISIDEFNQIAKENGIVDSAELLKNLHALGVCLRYDDMGDFDTLVLNPDWISFGIYRIINWAQEQGGHSISIDDFSIIFENEAVRYPKSKFLFLYELMKRYELAYETERKDCLIIPHLLREDRPDTLPDFPESESLKFLYQAKQPLPPNSISQFIVRHNKEIKKEGKGYLVWRHGVVLEDENGSIALVREWEEEREITVFVKGKDKTVYLDKLRETLNNIFDDMFKSNESEKPELQYRIVRPEPIPDEKEKPLSFDQIVAHVIKDIPFLDPVTGQLIDLKSTAKAFNINIYNNPAFTSYQGRDFVTQTFNFHNCNIDLQGNLTDLASSLKRKGEIEDAEILEDAVEALSQAEQYKTPEEVKKKGIINKLKRTVDILGDENSNLYNSIKSIKHGISIAQDIAKGYNDIAQWCGLPQVPKPFFGKE